MVKSHYQNKIKFSLKDKGVFITGLIIITGLLFSPFVFAKGIEITDKDVERIKTGLGLIKTFQNIVLPDEKLKAVVNTTIGVAETGTDVTYGLLVLTALNEMDLVDMVVSQRYKTEATAYFNHIVDERTNLVSYWKGVGFDLPRVLSGNIPGPTSALTLNSFAITDKIISIFSTLNVIKQEILYDGLWRYFDERRNHLSHEEAWESAKWEMGWVPDPEDIKKLHRWHPARKINEEVNQLESQFATLWDKWGPYVDERGIKEEFKEQVRTELRETIAEQIKIQESQFVQKPAEPTAFEKTKLAFGNLMEKIKKVGTLVGEELTEIIRKVQELARFGGAQVNPQLEGELSVETEQKLEETKIEEQNKKAEESKSATESVGVKPRQDGQGEPKPLSLEELQRKLSEISKTIEALSKRVNQLTIGVEPRPPDEQIEEEVEKLDEEEPQKEQAQITICQKKSGDYSLRNKIIFNEIAWMGTTNSANDEWIELKNISGKEIDLTGWQILDKDQQIKIIFDVWGSTLRIGPGGFLLLERTNDDSAPGVAADLIYTGGLNNSNEALYLFDKNCQLLDEVIANPDWSAGDNSSKRTMERKLDLTWQTSLNPGGTPKRENSSGYVGIPSAVSGGGGGGGGGGEESQPKITLSYPQNNPVNKDIEVILSVSNLKNATYDVKISIENGTTTLSEIYNETKSKWQSSFNYLVEVFSGTSFSRDFKLKIKDSENNFRGEADIFAKIRETGKTSIYIQFSGKINITNPEENPKQNQSPEASFNFSPQNPTTGDLITFDASNSTDTDGTILNYLWDFNEGTSTGVTTTHSYLTSGTSTVTLLVTDDRGATGSTSTMIFVSGLREPAFAQNVVISEVLAAGNNEFVELYNPTDRPISMSGWYLCYFSQGREWNNPTLKKEFVATSTIATSSHYLIAFGDYPEIGGNPDPDWKPYKTHLSDDAGAIGIFSCNPKIATTTAITLEQAIEQAKACKIDIVAWGNATTTAEGEPASAAPAGKTLARKIATTSEGVLTYIDSNNNSSDFEIQDPTPKARNQHSFPDLDGDGIIDSCDSTTTITTTIELNAGEYKFKDLVIMQGGKLILNSSSNLAEFKGVKIVAENLFIDASSSISADGLGYGHGEGSGAGQNGSMAGGGGYGGAGGYNLAANIYGSFSQPADLGSGGGDAPGNFSFIPGGAGGGAIWIEVNQSLTLDGEISVNGTDGGASTDHPWAIIASLFSGGGSGGSVYITTNVLTGSGLIQANGGKGGYVDPGFEGGGGGGGRIAVYYQTKEFNGSIEAQGGLYNLGGGAGTIYLKSASQTLGDLILDNGDISGADSILEGAGLAFNNLKILNKANFILPEDLSANEIEVRNADLEARAESTIFSFGDFSLNSGSSLIGPAQIFLFVNINNDFIIQSNSKLIGNFNIRAENLTIDASSSISANGKGFQHSDGQGAGTDSGRAGGAGYGGRGGDTPSVSGGEVYGSTSTPADLGSGGGDAPGDFSFVPGGVGGGAIRIEVNQTLTLDGEISVNGTDGGASTDHPWAIIASLFSGGGSGGSIYITTNVFTGTGLIQTNGGKGGYVDPDFEGGGGGGGRIAVYYQSIEFTGEIQVLGGQGSSESYSGKHGTIYLEEK